MNALQALMLDLERPGQRAAGEAAVWRRSVVTAVQSSPPAVQLELSGDEAWVRYPSWYSPAVGDEVEVLVQGADLIVLTHLA